MFLPFAYGPPDSFQDSIDVAKAVRIIAHALFIAAFLYLGLIGNNLYKLSLRLHLLNHDKLAILNTAGWLSATALFSPVIKVHRLPNSAGGF
jgi:hypothetical protein